MSCSPECLEFMEECYMNQQETGAFKKLLTIHNETMKENFELKGQLEDDTRQVHQLFAENEALKEENKKQKKQHIQSLMKTNSLAKELYREVKYALGYGEFEEPKRQDMYDKIKKLQEENNELKEELNKYKEAESLLLVQPNPEAFAEKIKELKEKNKKLVELHNLVSVQANADNEELQSFIKKLEERLEQAEESLDNAGYKWIEEKGWYSCEDEQ